MIAATPASFAPVRVGIIGCGEVVQVVHLPTLTLMADLFQITYLCDASDDALAHCAKKVAAEPPKTTRMPEELCSSPDVDVVLIANSDAYHAAHAILGLEHDKVVFVEKPMALNKRDADAIIRAESKSAGKLMVGYMRRYAPAFEDALRELGGIGKVTYARVRGVSILPRSSRVERRRLVC
jgi:predicted dehydrogenase